MTATGSFRQKLPQGARCAYCGALATTRDHIVPKAKGGRAVRANMNPACAPCNNVKADHEIGTFTDWLKTPAGRRWAGQTPPMRSVTAAQSSFARFRGYSRKPQPMPKKGPEPSLVASWPRGGRDDYEGD